MMAKMISGSVSGAELADERRRRGHTARAVASELMVDKVTMSRWENSQFLPRRVAYALRYAMQKIEEVNSGGA